MQTVSIGDSLHEMSNPVYGENKKNISKCCLLKILLRVLSDSRSRLFLILNQWDFIYKDSGFSFIRV